MSTKIQKLSLLSDMILFAQVDGKLHKKEYLFLSIIAVQLGVDKATFSQLFHQEIKSKYIKSEFARIEQFYRLALLMHCDGVLHEKENSAIHEIGVTMGLNPFAINRVLIAMAKSPTQMVTSDYLLKIFQEQLN